VQEAQGPHHILTLQFWRQIVIGAQHNQLLLLLLRDVGLQAEGPDNVLTL
jgi:hypothetical protein